MSLEAMSWAIGQDLKTTPKMVLMALANCHNASSGLCCPGYPYLAVFAGCDLRTVERQVRALEREHGLIETLPAERADAPRRFKLLIDRLGPLDAHRPDAKENVRSLRRQKVRPGRKSGPAESQEGAAESRAEAPNPPAESREPPGTVPVETGTTTGPATTEPGRETVPAAPAAAPDGAPDSLNDGGGERVNPGDVARQWNAMAQRAGLRLVHLSERGLGADRRRKIRVRFGAAEFRRDWGRLLHKLEHEAAWAHEHPEAIDFDWLLANDLNWRKVLEGKYDRGSGAMPVAGQASRTGRAIEDLEALK